MGTQLHSEPTDIPATVLLSTRQQVHKLSRTRPRTKLVRRTDRDYSQTLRRSYQFAFLLLNLWLGLRFYVWVRHIEIGLASSGARPSHFADTHVAAVMRTSL